MPLFETRSFDDIYTIRSFIVRGLSGRRMSLSAKVPGKTDKRALYGWVGKSLASALLAFIFYFGGISLHKRIDIWDQKRMVGPGDYVWGLVNGVRRSYNCRPACRSIFSQF